MTSFKKLMERQEAMINRLSDFSGLEPSLVANVVQYGKHVCSRGTQEVSDNAFTFQMMKKFYLTNSIMISQMFEVLKRRNKVPGREFGFNKSRNISLEDFCVCICTFLTDNMDLKSEWVFNVYDTNADDSLSRTELYYLLKPCVLHSDDTDTEEAIKDLVEIVLTIVDLDQNGCIDMTEFKNLIKRNVLYIDLLGQCLPRRDVMERFVHTIKKKSPQEVSRMFQREFEKGLQVPTSIADHSLYPIHLDLP